MQIMGCDDGIKMIEIIVTKLRTNKARATASFNPKL